MDLLERYLSAIRHNLPASRAADITDELRDELLGQVEAREAQLGRPLEEKEVAAIVKAFGPPLTVAGRYREHQYLIGPDTYPYYLYGLRATFVIVLAIFFLSAILPALVSTADPVRAFLRSLGNASMALLTMFALLTIIFAFVERTGFAKAQAKAWVPESLPAHDGPQKRKKGKWESPIEVGLTLLLLLLWTGVIPLPIPVGHHGAGVRLTPTEVWSDNYWLVLSLGVLSLAHKLIGWLRANGSTEHLILVLNMGWIWAAARIRAGGPWFTATSAPEFAEQAVRAQAGVNALIAIVLVFIIIAWSIGLLMSIYQLYLRRVFVGR